MPSQILNDAFISINGVDLSDHVETVEMTYSEELKRATAMGDTGEKRLPSGIGDCSLAITFYQDYDAAKVDATLFPLVGAAQFAVKFRKSKTDAIAATNPEYQFNGMIEGDLPLGGGGVGEMNMAAVTFVSADGVRLTRDITPEGMGL